MRDPDLVLQAEQAARALERAWHRWRVVHGLAADLVPPVSSYVGYSLDEPWGQPRVVFGLAAEEAEQLVAMLEQHDCFGPVHAAVAALPGRCQPSRGLASLAVPLPVPPQVQSSAAGQPASVDRRPDSRSDPLDTSALPEAGDLRDRRREEGSAGSRGEGAGRAADDPPDYAVDGAEGPVYLQATAALQEAAAAAQYSVAQYSAAQNSAARCSAARHAAPPDHEIAGSRPEITVNGAVREHEQDPSGLDLSAVPPTDSAALPAEAGPLTQAASAARAEAEARIKAALRERRSAAETQDPYADASREPVQAQMPAHAEPAYLESAYAEPAQAQLPACAESACVQPAYAEPEHAGPSRSAGSDAAADLSDTAYFLAAMPRPEVASGAFTGPAMAASRLYPGVVPEAGQAGEPGTEIADTAEIHQPAVAAFRPRPELAAYLDAGPESSPFFDSPEDPPDASFTRRSRIARGHALPRMPRSKRHGSTPGT